MTNSQIDTLITDAMKAIREAYCEGEEASAEMVRKITFLELFGELIKRFPEPPK